MSFEQTNFGFQSRKNSSYIKKDNEGAKIFRKLLDILFSISNKTTLLSPDKYLKETLVKSLPLLFLPSTLHPLPTWLFK